MSRLLTAALLAAALHLPTAQANTAGITLDQAIQRASKGAPRLLAAEAGIDGAKGGLVQAGVRPNPTVTVTADNIAGTGRYGVFGQSEVTASYAQTFERGDKRTARTSYAGADIQVAEAMLGVARLDLAAQVERAYFDVIIADEIAWAAEYRLKAEQEIEAEAVRRVRGYKDPLFVESRAAARVAAAHVNLEAAKRQQKAARNLLASFWGGSGEGLDVAGGVLVASTCPKSLAASDEAFKEARIARAEAGIGVAQSRAVPDYTVSGGVRYLRETGDFAVVSGITIPIGRYDRNQGNIDRAQAERSQLSYEAEADRSERLRRLAMLCADAESARLRADSIRLAVLPHTVRTLAQVREGYRRGGFNFRDVQDAADAIVQVQDQWIAAANLWRDLQTEIDRISGRFDAPVRGETGQ